MIDFLKQVFQCQRQKRVLRSRLLGLTQDIRNQMDGPLTKMSMRVLRDSLESLMKCLFEWDECYYKRKVYLSMRDFRESIEVSMLGKNIGMVMIDMMSDKFFRLSDDSEVIGDILKKVEMIV